MATAGRSCPAPVSLMDIYPTLNELCQLEQKVPQMLAGHSLAPLLNDPDANWPYVAVSSHGEGNAAVTDARYHYIRYADGAEELYDHQNDPREYVNLAKQPELKPVILQSLQVSSAVMAHRGPQERRKAQEYDRIGQP